jgi:hypothetical protein
VSLGGVTDAPLRFRAAAFAHRHHTLLTVTALGAEVVAVSIWLATYTGQIRDWLVMTDEMLYAKLGRSIATDWSLVPQIHDQSMPVYNLLYPLLLAPFYGSASATGAFHGAHLLNPVVMASAAVPAYLLARTVLPRVLSLVAALLAVLVPWMAYATLLMTEVVAYPAFLWSTLALLWALQRPSWRRDLLAVAGLVLAALARTQFILLALVFPVALLLHEGGYEAAMASRGTRLRAMARGARRGIAAHPLLVVVYGIGAVYAVASIAAGSTTHVLGAYGAAARGSLFPDGLWTNTAAQLDQIGVGTGLLPLLVGGAWLVARSLRPAGRKEHALAVLGLVLVVSLAFETTSFALRFTGEATADRYLFYVAPLLSVATLAAVRQPRGLWPAVAGTTAFFVATVYWLELPRFRGLWTNSPARFLNGTLADRAESLHMGTAAFVALLAVLLAGLVALAVRRLSSRGATAAVACFLLVFSAVATRDLLEQTVDQGSWSGRPMTGPREVRLDWVDDVVPTGHAAAIVPFPRSLVYGPTAIRWWDAEFWNNAVTRAFVTAGPAAFSYTPFPTRRLSFDWETGRATSPAELPPYVVVDRRETRFRIAGTTQKRQEGLDVVRADRLPYRVLWQTNGFYEDGWLKPGREGTVRVYAQRDRAETLELTLVVRRPRGGFARYTLRTGDVLRTVTLTLDPAATHRIRVCIAPGKPADVTLTGTSTVFRRKAWPGQGLRPVTAPLSRVSVRFVRVGCT